MEKSFIGIDVGGTMIKGALISANGEILKKNAVPTLCNKGPDACIQNISKLVISLSDSNVASVGVGIAGIIDKTRQRIIVSPNLAEFNNISVRAKLQEYIPQPVFIENDANCAALGELWAGTGRGRSNYLFCTIGTGIGGGLILNGKLWKGESGKAGEFGHITLVHNGLPCQCGKSGCLEAYSSGTALVRMAKEAIVCGRETILNISEEITPEAIYRAARSGDKLSCELFKIATKHLATAFASVNSLLDIHEFIIGGGVAQAFELFRDVLMEEICKQVFPPSCEKISVNVSSLGNDAGIYGAAYHALRSMKSGAC